MSNLGPLLSQQSTFEGLGPFGPMIGFVQGGRHMPAAGLLQNGWSPHPLQRAGVVAFTNLPSMAAAAVAGFDTSVAPARSTAADLAAPLILNPSIVAATASLSRGTAAFIA